MNEFKKNSLKLVVHVGLTLRYEWPVLWPIVNPHVLILAILGKLLDLLLFLLFNQKFWKMTVPHDSFNLLVVLVFFLQFVSVGQLLFLSGKKWLDLVRGVALPNSQASVLGARHKILGIVRVQDRVDLLHALRVVDLS